MFAVCYTNQSFAQYAFSFLRRYNNYAICISSIHKARFLKYFFTVNGLIVKEKNVIHKQSSLYRILPCSTRR